MHVDLSNLAIAIDYVGCDGEAYLDSKTAEIHLINDAFEEEIPDDIETNEKYISIPPKQEFDLGRSLVISFAEQTMPDALDDIYDMFRASGAYSRFKSMLHGCDMLDKWHDFENKAVDEKLIEWCEESGLLCLQN